FIESCRHNGARVLDDYFGGDQDGAFHACTNQRRGRRQDAAKAFLKPVRNRPNLKVLTRHEALRVLFDDRRATGVEVEAGGVRRTIAARREVILAAGTIQSPIILMRSGVGPGDQLSAAAIPIVHANPEIGQNLREHPMTILGKYVNVPTFNVQMGLPNLAWQFARYMLAGRGMLTSPAAHAMAVMRSDPALEEPDLQLIFSPLLIEQKRDAKNQAFVSFADRPGIRMSTYVCRPHSRGQIRLDTKDPTGAPVIEPRMLEDPRDLKALMGGARLLDRLAKSPGLDRFVTGDADSLPTDDAALADHLRATIGIGYHPIGTCRMAGGSEGVVDPQLRVRGVTGLRVIDASVMPTLVSANTLAPALMIAEKGADMVLQHG
ncbi:MAG: GMC oxidoreductase, partial [Rhizorhabdus sp.]